MACQVHRVVNDPMRGRTFDMDFDKCKAQDPAHDIGRGFAQRGTQMVVSAPCITQKAECQALCTRTPIGRQTGKILWRLDQYLG